MIGLELVEARGEKETGGLFSQRILITFVSLPLLVPDDPFQFPFLMFCLTFLLRSVARTRISFRAAKRDRYPIVERRIQLQQCVLESR
ncbi:hypothetical protein L228DRAFT_247518 [Xylona heveae TC161]|uniref:Uncharacterized protein n=1 Tax=Xylona heveae (strain CBS 132557 / TC161) TaxID=1328760 RepID=A0A165H6Z7_XYLHT|nr:hypothetical protein L228DRAFT_247518 [Xylona heveae TC161]KZF23071.1 hypothetical protein L228DRAFT_247518 [Xylona heveae TC161]